MNKLELFEEFEKITKKIIDLDLNSIDLIDQVEELIETREELMKSIDASEGTVPSEVLNRIMQKNIQAETKLQEIVTNIQVGLKAVVDEKKLSSVKKKAHRGYLNPGHQNDGYFIDKKK